MADDRICVICRQRTGDLYRVRYGYVQTFQGKTWTVYGTTSVSVPHQNTVGSLAEHICSECIPEWKPLTGRWKYVAIGLALMAPLFVWSYVEDAWSIELPTWLGFVVFSAVLLSLALGVAMVLFALEKEKPPDPREHRTATGKRLVWSCHAKELNARYGHATQAWELQGDQIPDISGSARRALTHGWDTLAVPDAVDHFRLRDFRTVTLTTSFGPLNDNWTLPEKPLVSPLLKNLAGFR